MKLSVIIPVFNEVENVDEMHAAVRSALTAYDYELILVDDGSTDGTVARLEALAAMDPEHTCVVEFRRNFGQTAAIAAGIDHAAGDVIVLMDADLQNDPADIPHAAREDRGRLRRGQRLAQGPPGHLPDPHAALDASPTG